MAYESAELAPRGRYRTMPADLLDVHSRWSWSRSSPDSADSRPVGAHDVRIPSRARDTVEVCGTAAPRPRSSTRCVTQSIGSRAPSRVLLDMQPGDAAPLPPNSERRADRRGIHRCAGCPSGNRSTWRADSRADVRRSHAIERSRRELLLKAAAAAPTTGLGKERALARAAHRTALRCTDGTNGGPAAGSRLHRTASPPRDPVGTQGVFLVVAMTARVPDEASRERIRPVLHDKEPDERGWAGHVARRYTTRRPRWVLPREAAAFRSSCRYSGGKLHEAHPHRDAWRHFGARRATLSRRDIRPKSKATRRSLGARRPSVDLILCDVRMRA